MQSPLFKVSIVLYALVAGILITGCDDKSDPKNQIKIILNAVDPNTKEKRVNMFDTIEVSVTRMGFPVKRYVKVAEYITDSTGSVAVKLDKNEEYVFMIGGNSNNFGSEWFSTEDRKDGEKVNIEVISLEGR